MPRRSSQLKCGKYNQKINGVSLYEEVLGIWILKKYSNMGKRERLFNTALAKEVSWCSVDEALCGQFWEVGGKVWSKFLYEGIRRNNWEAKTWGPWWEILIVLYVNYTRTHVNVRASLCTPVYSVYILLVSICFMYTHAFYVYMCMCMIWDAFCLYSYFLTYDRENILSSSYFSASFFATVLNSCTH